MITMTVRTRSSIEDIKNNWLNEIKPKLKVCLKCLHCWLPNSEQTKYCSNCRNKYDSINKFKHKKKDRGKNN